MKLILNYFFFLVGIFNICHGQKQIKFNSAYTSFPDTGRIKGHIYHDSLYSADAHYSNNSVIAIIPKNLSAQKPVDMIFWFHGWNNNIDSALIRYGLSRQFDESGLNAVLVLAETAKDAPDSYGGKLQENNMFNRLVTDVKKNLVNSHIISARTNTGNIILAGHSGAYRVIANILQNGNVPVKEVILFDALYADTPTYLAWVLSDTSHRFINLYTDHGGTKEETDNMMHQLTEQHIKIDSVEETNLSPEFLQQNKIIFIHTFHEHNDIIQHPDNFKLFIETSPFLSKPQIK